MYTDVYECIYVSMYVRFFHLCFLSLFIFFYALILCLLYDAHLLSSYDILTDEHFVLMTVKQRGWWQIRDGQQINQLTEALHPRGIRERNLLRSLQKQLDVVVSSCDKTLKEGQCFLLKASFFTSSAPFPLPSTHLLMNCSFVSPSLSLNFTPPSSSFFTSVCFFLPSPPTSLSISQSMCLYLW